MVINEQTKISAIIKNCPEAIDAIASINKHFIKLKNPILRRLLASRVNISDAAKIGNCSVDKFIEKLTPLGFDFKPLDTLNNNKSNVMNANEKILQKSKSYVNMKAIPIIDKREDPFIGIMNHLDLDKVLKDKNQKIVSINAIPILNKGEDPFKEIMSKMKTLQHNEILHVIAPFEPAPLITIFKKKGFNAYVKSSPSRVDTYFVKGVDEEVSQSEETSYFKIEPNDLEQRKKMFGNKIKEINVCDLEMPMPMISINNMLSELPADEALYVYHRKIPEFLIAELQQNGYTIFLSELSENNVRLLIFK